MTAMLARPLPAFRKIRYRPDKPKREPLLSDDEWEPQRNVESPRAAQSHSMFRLAWTGRHHPAEPSTCSMTSQRKSRRYRPKQVRKSAHGFLIRDSCDRTK